MTLERYYEKPTGMQGEYSYDRKAHMWLIAPEYIQSVTRCPFDKAVRKSRSFSMHVYNLMYRRFTATSNRGLVEWLVNCTAEGRDMMIMCLKEQCEADAQSSIDSIAYQSPLSEKGKDYKPEDMALACVAPMVHDMLQNAIVCGIRIYNGNDYGVRLGADRYERWDY